MRHSISLLALSAAATTTASAKSTTHNETIYKYTYELNTTHQGWPNFFSGFDLEDDANPPGSGFAAYVNQSYALSNNMISNGTDGAVRIGVDHTTTISSRSKSGRKAVRLNSKLIYSYGLFIADFTHMPGGICGTWPAFWMSGPTWPVGGELDILEGVNTATHNKITGYTNATGTSCTNTLANITSTLSSSDCTDLDDTGCSMLSSSASSYGTSFNANSGGVYATEWTEQTGIRVWFFPRGGIPGDIGDGRPEPSGWGTPAAAIPAESCDMSTHFFNMQLVLNTNFCGSWGNRTWKTSGCGKLADTCEGYVRSNPEAFEDAYWEVNYIKSYTGRNISSTVAVNETTSAAAQSIRPPTLLKWLTKMMI